MLLEAPSRDLLRCHMPGPAVRCRPATAADPGPSAAVGGYQSSPAELELLARALITTWAARTGRRLRDVPVDELTAAELEEFWVDDQLEPPYCTPTRRRTW